jgi:NitT/TauT family transport system ATP-binding protein
MKSIITLKNISKIFRDNPHRPLHVLNDISLHIHQKEFFVLVGTSGSGKSTLLRIMCNLEKKYEGEVEALFNPEDVSFVFQQFGLLPWLTVEGNVELGLIARNIPESIRKKKVAEELALLGLTDFRASFPRDLSGGMRQRVGIARALATDPKIMFMDEPFSELDSFTAQGLRKELLEIWKQRGLTVVMVTHIIPDAVELGSRIAVMSQRPGSIKKIIENSLPYPRNPRSPESYKIEDEVNDLLRP